MAGALMTAGSDGARWYADRQLDGARQQALAAAKQLTLSFVSISASTVDRDLERIVAGSTGEFADEFTRGMPQVRAAVAENNVESHGTVLRAGLVSADRDSAVALVAIDATVKNVRAPDGRLSHYRIQVDLAKDARSGHGGSPGCSSSADRSTREEKGGCREKSEPEPVAEVEDRHRDRGRRA